MKKIIFTLLLFLTPLSVKADKIYSVDMKIDIEKDGTANITEIWDVKASGGSEWYKQIIDLGNSDLSNYKVSMDGKELLYKQYWNINGSMDEKAGYYGINGISDGLELCFGKTDKKRHKFILTYTISNYVFNTNDSQVLYWTLLPNVDLDNFTVEVSSYYSFPDTLDVWGYGYKGYAYVENGKIKMSNDGKLKDEYVVLLAKFPLNTFATTNRYLDYNTFNDVYELAEEGTFDYDYDNNLSFFDIIYGIFGILMDLVPILFFILLPVILSNRKKYGYKNNKIIDKKNVPFFREIPCNKDIYYANALIKLNNFDYKETNILGAIILKWVKNKKVIFINEEKGIFNKSTTTIDLRLNPTFDNELEQKLFDMMYKASKDGLLEARELEKWCKNNYSKFFGLFTKIENNEINRLKAENHIYKRTDKAECKKQNVMDDTIYYDSVKLYGLKLFLQEFSRIDTKEVLEVHLWDEYLMFAYLFGIADKVAKQLKNMYPEVLQQMDFDYDTIVFVNSITTRSVSAASSARSAAQSYSSGGGGFSSGGGGGGSFGGGGGSRMGGR